MGLPLRCAPLDDVRALIAREWLGAGDAPSHSGHITLRPHQRDAVARLRAVMADHGGALLADDVGLGKTYVATAIIAEARAALIVCPASLRAMWRSALEAAGTDAEILTYSALSRGNAPQRVPSLLVLDEAHHARTPGAHRYAAIARLAAGARVLALSATPIHNSRDDLAAVLALFLGARAWAMNDAELAHYVVRREHHELAPGDLPALDGPHWISIGDDAPLLRAIAELPPPVPPAGGEDGGALVAWGLARQWASSRAALEGALRRRLARAAALEAALADGRYPSARELSAWTASEDSVQLAFPSLVAGAHPGSAELANAVRRHAAALRALLARTRDDPGVDAARAARISELRAAHPGERIVAFAQFADTVHALYGRLAPAGAVAALTARGARVAGGTLSRQEVLARFSPRRNGGVAPHRRDRIELLLTTDLLSEGLDLSDASIVVHLDLPWTPARLEQRVGRSRRLGAPHARTLVHAFAPPAGAEQLLEVERRLRKKLGAMARATGLAGAVLPSFGAPVEVEPAAARQREEVHRIMRSWRRTRIDEAEEPPPVIATGSGASKATIILARARGGMVLAGALGGDDPSEDTAALIPALQAVSRATAIDPPAAIRQRAVRDAELWLTRRQAGEAAGGASVFQAPSRRTALHRIAAITGRAMHHRRALIAPLAATARRVITTPFGIGAERILDTLAEAPLADEAWLRALREFGAIHAGGGNASPLASAATELLAMILVLGPSSPPQ